MGGKKKSQENTSKELFCGLGCISIILKFLKRYSRSESSKLEGRVRPTTLNSLDNWRFVTHVAMLRALSQMGWTPLLGLHHKSSSHHSAVTPSPSQIPVLK